MKDILQKAKAIQKKFSPFITITDELRSGRGRLAGYAVSFKDNICTAGMRTTAGSRMLEDYIPPMDATVVERIKASGGAILGKTAMDEFGLGTFATNCAFGIPKNPLDTSRSCGGSSGGAACVTAAADFPHIAIAESTGGSISCPAAFTGTVGLTPTYGRVSRWGLIDYANSLDKIGVIAKNVHDAALAIGVIAGKDDYDSTVIDTKEDWTIGNNVKGWKIGVPKEYFQDIDEKVADAVWNGIKRLESMGATYHEISLSHTRYALAAYYIIAMSEVSTNLAKFAGMRYGLQKELVGNFDEYFTTVRTEGFGEEAKRRIILGTFARMAGYREAYYLKALQVRTKVIEDFKHAFKQCDVLAAPTMPTIAPKFSEIAKLSPVENYMMDVLTVGPNLAGIPMISIPAGNVQKMPVGLHLMGDHMQERKILQAANAFEVDR